MAEPNAQTFIFLPPNFDEEQRQLHQELDKVRGRLLTFAHEYDSFVQIAPTLLSTESQDFGERYLLQQEDLFFGEIGVIRAKLAYLNVRFRRHE
jgi:hypothetical protein